MNTSASRPTAVMMSSSVTLTKAYRYVPFVILLSTSLDYCCHEDTFLCRFTSFFLFFHFLVMAQWPLISILSLCAMVYMVSSEGKQVAWPRELIPAQDFTLYLQPVQCLWLYKRIEYLSRIWQIHLLLQLSTMTTTRRLGWRQQNNSRRSSTGSPMARAPRCVNNQRESFPGWGSPSEGGSLSKIGITMNQSERNGNSEPVDNGGENDESRLGNRQGRRQVNASRLNAGESGMEHKPSGIKATLKGRKWGGNLSERASRTPVLPQGVPQFLSVRPTTLDGAIGSSHRHQRQDGAVPSCDCDGDSGVPAPSAQRWAAAAPAARLVLTILLGSASTDKWSLREHLHSFRLLTKYKWYIFLLHINYARLMLFEAVTPTNIKRTWCMLMFRRPFFGLFDMA